MGPWLPGSDAQSQDQLQSEMLIKDLWTCSSPYFPFPLVLAASMPAGIGNGDFFHLDPLYPLQRPWCHHHCKAQAGVPASHPAPVAFPEEQSQQSDRMSPQHGSQHRGWAAWAARPAQTHGWAQPQPKPPPRMGCNSGATHTRSTSRTLRDFFSILGKGELLIF